MTGNAQARVLIAGGGPVGLFAALVLAHHGIASVVVEADADVCDGSRAICISRRSLQILDRVGAAAPFLAHGLHWRYGRSYLGSRQVFELTMPQSDGDRFPPFINLQQNRAEKFLRDACARSGLVDVQWSSKIVRLDTSEHGLTAHVEGAAGVRHLSAEWLIAADGARSTIRDALGLRLEGNSYDSRYLIADIEMQCDWPTERKVWFDPASNPGSTVIMHRQPENVWRIDYQLRPEQDSEAELQDEQIRQRIATHLAFVGLNCDWRLLWKSLYQARTLSLRHYVHGRVIFAGDAAHLVPIFGVRGLNSGLDDAMNLAWKLAYVLKGITAAPLLASYDKERKDAYEDNIASAIKSTWFMSPPSEGFVLARDAVLELATRFPQFRPLIDPRQSSAHRYRSAAILENPDCALIGWPLPEVRLADGRSIHEWLGPEFSTLSVADASSEVSIRDRIELGIGVRQIELPGRLLPPSGLALRPGQIVVIRPDSYVAACAVSGDDALRAIAMSIGVTETLGAFADA